MEFSLASLNIWALFADWEKRRLVLRTALSKIEKPDILCLQEVILDSNIDQAKEIAEEIGYPYLLFTEDRPSDYSDGVEGIAILSTFPFEEVETSELFHTSVRRVMTRVYFKSLDIELTNTHLSFSEDDESKKQLIEVLSVDAEKPDLLCGDFNQTPEQVASVLKESPSWKSDAHFNTWPVDPEQFKIAREAFLGKPLDFITAPRQIDYILSRGQLELVSSQKFDLQANNGLCASDHALICNRYKT